MRRAITALSGVFAALSWIELKAIDSCITDDQQRDASAALCLAGELICDGLVERF